MVNYQSQYLLQAGLNVAFFSNFVAVHVSSLPDNFVLWHSNCSKNKYVNACNDGNPGEEWRDLEIVAEEMFRFQNDLRPHEGQTSQDRLVLILCESVSQQAASDFVSRISSIHVNVQFISFQIQKTDAYVSDEMENIVDILVRNRNITNNVIMFLENTTNILNIINKVSNAAELKYTVVHHVTEWMIVSRHFPKLTSRIQERAFQIDFISMIYKDANNTISIVQKSRGGSFSIRAKVLSNHVLKFISLQESYKTVEMYFKSLAARKSIRKSGDLYLKSKKSVMAGLHIPVAMYLFEFEDWNVSVKTIKMINRDNYHQFAMALLAYLAKYLDFTYYFVVPDDGGYFGIVTDGNATGITGKFLKSCEHFFCLSSFPAALALNYFKFAKSFKSLKVSFSP